MSFRKISSCELLRALLHNFFISCLPNQLSQSLEYVSSYITNCAKVGSFGLPQKISLFMFNNDMIYVYR